MKLILVGLLVTILAVHYSEQADFLEPGFIEISAEEQTNDARKVEMIEDGSGSGDGPDPSLLLIKDRFRGDESGDDDFKERIVAKLQGLEQKLDRESGKLDKLLNEIMRNKYETKSKLTKFKRIGRKYYHIENKKKLNWFEAADSCRQMGANLASPQSEEEFNALNAKLTNSLYWLGINDLGTEGLFKSTISGQKPEYVNWHKGEPNNYEDEDCVELKLMGKKRAMNDYGCHNRSYYICEKNYLF